MSSTGESSEAPFRRWAAALEIALVLAVFFLQAGWPAPEVNEPHYLGKARHFWNHDWAKGDFFFESNDTHWVFYLTCGWPTRWMSLAQFAWLGRLTTWLLLAAAWQRLCQAVVGRVGWALPSAALFLIFNVGCHLAGEWVIGGFEAKGLAYALVFAALAALVSNRWNTALLLLGMASALHVLVGGWSAVAAGVCWLLAPDRPRLRNLWPGIACGALAALLGIVPALALNWNTEPQIVAEANEIYVFQRLPHHLVPQSFRWPFLLRYLCMLLTWAVMNRARTDNPRLQKLRSFVVGSLAIAFCGFAISVVTANYPDARAALLRFYWFRLADVMLPVGIGLSAILSLQDSKSSRRNLRAAFWLAVCGALVFYARDDYATGNPLGNLPRADKSGKVLDHDDWRDVCEWMGQHSPQGALAITPRMAQTYTWYAGRGQVVSWKDLPQDAVTVVRWRQRLEDIYGMPHPEFQRRWRDSLTELSPERLLELGRRYGADYLIVEAEPPLDLPKLHGNKSYAVYRLTTTDRP
ncbi:MAG TPA: DUF6798 domain-containing protein [Pirellulales bacterium]|nr:DUF6798 domain-containing protein [Pirellulales bacterium]